MGRGGGGGRLPAESSLPGRVRCSHSLAADFGPGTSQPQFTICKAGLTAPVPRAPGAWGGARKQTRRSPGASAPPPGGGLRSALGRPPAPPEAGVKVTRRRRLRGRIRRDNVRAQAEPGAPVAAAPVPAPSRCPLTFQPRVAAAPEQTGSDPAPRPGRAHFRPLWAPGGLPPRWPQSL